MHYKKVQDAPVLATDVANSMGSKSTKTTHARAKSIFITSVGVGVLSLTITAHSAEAPTGYDGLSNGYLSKSDYQQALDEFNLAQTIPMGLGPVFNDVSCQACHKGPVDGGHSNVSVQRAGYFDGVNFFDPPGGSLVIPPFLV